MRSAPRAANRMPTNICSFNGELMPEANAQVPILDRGFLFGDSIYEVFRTRHGHLFAWQEHLARLRLSAEGLAIELDLSDAEILRQVIAARDAAGHAESYLRLIVTRGTGTAPNIDVSTVLGPPNWIVMARDLGPAPPPVHLALVDRIRVDRRALDPALKSGNYLNNVLALREAKAAGATDCVLLNQKGQVTEASTSNLFALHDRVWTTPPVAAGVLHGITRQLLLDYCRDTGIELAEQHLSAHDLANATELALSSTLRDFAPVTRFNGEERFVSAASRELADGFATYCDRKAAGDDAAILQTLLR